MTTPSDDKTSVLKTFLEKANCNFPKLPATEKRLASKTIRKLLVQFMRESRAAIFPSPLGFMGYNSAVFTAQEFAHAYPAHPLPEAIPARPAWPNNPTAIAVAEYNHLNAIYTAYMATLAELKHILEYIFAPDIADLADELNGLADIQPGAIFTAGWQAHGHLLPTDITTLQTRASAPPDRSITPEENIIKILHVFKTLENLGDAYRTNDATMFKILFNHIASMCPQTKKIAERYYEETSMDARRTATLIDFVKLGLSRLPTQPDLSLYRHAYNVDTEHHSFSLVKRTASYARDMDQTSDSDNDDHTDSLALATTSVHTTKGAKPKPKYNTRTIPATREDRIALHRTLPVGHYCFVHGYGRHTGWKSTEFPDGCTVLHLPANTYTATQIATTGPTYKGNKLLAIDGEFPCLKVAPGYRLPA